ncbi:MAG TPA: hypothetical protein VLM75_01725 [Spirochaetota bacterium]|nr:hypothetical protein [Spirochaetota bacterium]
MNAKALRVVIPALVIIALMAGFGGLTGCAGGDMATVTIRVGNQLAKADMPSVVDRIIAFLSLSSRVQADPVPFDVYDVSLMVSGAGMASITRNIPESGELTLDVPSGAARTFTVVGYDEVGYRYMGGITTRDLSPGESTTISIQMGYLLSAPNSYSAGSGSPSGIYLQWEYVTFPEPSDLLGFKIYRANNTGDGPGTYYVISAGSRESYYDGGIYFLTDPTGVWGDPSSVASYYRISALNQYGESEPTPGFSNGW